MRDWRSIPPGLPLLRRGSAAHVWSQPLSRGITPFVDGAPGHELSWGDVVIECVSLGWFHLQRRVHPEERLVAANVFNSRHPKVPKRAGYENHGIVVARGVLNRDCPNASIFAFLHKRTGDCDAVSASSPGSRELQNCALSSAHRGLFDSTGP